MSKVPRKPVAKKKSTPAQKNTPKKKNTSSIQLQPIRIVLEIVVKQSGQPDLSASMLGGAAPSIDYSFDVTNTTVLSLSIEDKTKPNPGKNGTIELDFIPLTGEILVSAVATGQGPGKLSLTYLGKKLGDDLFFNFDNGVGSINQKVKIP